MNIFYSLRVPFPELQFRVYLMRYRSRKSLVEPTKVCQRLCKLFPSLGIRQKAQKARPLVWLDESTDRPLLVFGGLQPDVLHGLTSSDQRLVGTQSFIAVMAEKFYPHFGFIPLVPFTLFLKKYIASSTPSVRPSVFLVNCPREPHLSRIQNKVFARVGSETASVIRTLHLS